MQTFYYNGTTAYINEPTPDTLPDEFVELGITKIYVQEDNFNTFKNSEIYADYKDILVPWNFNIFKVTSTDWDPENNTNALYTVDGGSTGDDMLYNMINSKDKPIIVDWEEIPDSAFANQTTRFDYEGNLLDSISGESFTFNYNLSSSCKKIVLGDNVKKIGHGAFYNFYNVKEISLGKNIEKIESNAFYYTFANQHELTLPENLKEIGYNAFNYLGGYLSGNYAVDLNFNNKLEIIGYQAFYNTCRLNTDLVFPEGLKYIGGNAFANTYLSDEKDEKHDFKIVIPSTVEYIGDNAFNMSSKYILKTNFVNNSNLDAEENNYWGLVLYDKIVNGYMITGSKAISFKSPAENRGFFGYLTSLTIPSDITELENNIFSGKKILGGYDNVTNESNIVFDSTNNYGLQEVFVNNGCYYDNNNTLLSINSNEINENSLVIPEGITSIGYSYTIKRLIFNSNIANITSVTLPSTLTTLSSNYNNNLFTGLSSLTSITIPNINIPNNFFNTTYGDAAIPTSGTLHCNETWYNANKSKITAYSSAFKNWTVVYDVE